MTTQTQVIENISQASVEALSFVRRAGLDA